MKVNVWLPNTQNNLNPADFELQKISGSIELVSHPNVNLLCGYATTMENQIKITYILL